MNKSRRAKIAHHEAAHVVVAFRLGVKVSYVTMFASEGAVASAQTHSAAYHADDANVAQGFENDAKIKLAGPYAQSRYERLDAVRRAVDGKKSGETIWRMREHLLRRRF